MFLKNYSQILIKTNLDFFVFLFAIFVAFLFVIFAVFFFSSIVIEGARTLFFFSVHIKETTIEKTKLLFIQINTNLSTFKDTKQSAKSHRDEAFIWKFLSCLSGIPSVSSGIPSCTNEMKSIPASYKVSLPHSITFIKKRTHLYHPVYYPVLTLA